MKINLTMVKNYLKIRFFIQNNKIKFLKKKNKNILKENVSLSISTNRNFLEQTMVMIASLENAGYNVNLYILNINLLDSDIEMIKKVSPSNVKINEIKITDDSLKELKISKKWPIEAWTRILIPKLVKDDYVIYLDVDCVVINNIESLLKNYKNNYISGVKSTYYMLNPKYSNMPHAVNSGVLLLNNKKLKEFDFSNKIIKYARENKKELIMPDQDSINYVCKDIMGNIEPKYNVMNMLFANTHKTITKKVKDKYYSQKDYDEALFNPCIIHFNGGPFSRPWEKGRIKHPYYKIYLYYNKRNWAILNKKI